MKWHVYCSKKRYSAHLFIVLLVVINATNCNMHSLMEVIRCLIQQFLQKHKGRKKD